MFRFHRQLNPKDSGSSFIEIIIAIVVLGIVGASLLGGMTSVDLVARKVSNLQTADMALNSAVSVINAATFKTCNNTVANPYIYSATPDPLGSDIGKLPAGVTISDVDGMLFENGQTVWKHCGPAGTGNAADYWPSTLEASLMQRIVIVYTKPDNTKVSRAVTKIFRGLDAEYGNSGQFKVRIMNPASSSVELDQAITVGLGFNKTVPLSTLNSLPNADIIYFAIPGYSGYVNPNVSGSNLSISIPTNTTEFRASVDVGAFDKKNAVYAIPATVTFAIDPTLIAPSPTPTPTVTPSPTPTIINAIYPGTAAISCPTTFKASTSKAPCTVSVNPSTRGTNTNLPTVTTTVVGSVATVSTPVVDPATYGVSFTMYMKSGNAGVILCKTSTTTDSTSFVVSQTGGSSFTITVTATCN